MKKALSWLVTFLMVAGILQIGTAPSISKAANEAQNASFIAVRFMPPYYNRDGKELPQGKKYPWQKGFDASMVEGGINAIYWTDFYIDINPAGGRSQGTHHWFGLLDDQGQLWLDPDGTFNYVEYDSTKDPMNLDGKYIPEACKLDARANAQNTQGPYKLMDLIKEDYEPMYFWDRNITNRKFRVAFSSMDSFQLELGSEGRKFQPSTVKGGDFDIGYRLFDFVYWGEPEQRFNETGAPPPVDEQANPLEEDQKTAIERETEAPYHKYHWYYNSTNIAQMHVHGGDELHTDNVSDFNQSWRVEDPVKPGPGGTGYNDQYLGYANISTYEPGEFIYRKGTHRDSSSALYYNLKYLVEEGDIRLTPVTVVVGTENRNYPPGAIVKHTDWDCSVQWTDWDMDPIFNGHGVTATPPDPNPTVSKIFKELFRFRIHFNDVGERSPYQKDEVHAENVKTTADYGYYPSKAQGLNNRGWNRYDIGEWIYKDDDSNPPWGTVSVGDQRLTNVNVPLLDREGNQVVQNIIKAGDLLILAEVLFGGCNAPDYNLSVQSDVWMADVDERAMPDAFTAASLKFQTSDFKQAQTVQKNTFLDPDGSKFFVPATTFQNVRLNYREFLGIQLFKDDGVNNMLSPTSIGELGKAVAHNLSDDYIEGKVGEEFIGADDQNIEDADFARPLLSFTEDIMFYDTGNLEYGCGEAIYRNENTVTNDPNDLASSYQIVNDGDIRLTDVVVTQGNNVISYKAGSRVSPGDADVGRMLHYFTHEHRFYDQEWPDLSIPRNYLYDIGENIYKISEEPVPLIPGVVPTFRFGTIDYANVLYYDVDGSETITPGDIRVFDLAGRFKPGSVVGVGMYNNPDLINPTLDVDVSAWIKIDVPNSVPSMNPINSNLPYYNRIRSAYVDMNNDGYINFGDIRLARIYDYPAYTMVQGGDKDVTSPGANPSLFAADHVWYDLYQKNQILLVPNATTPNIPVAQKFRITPYSVFVNVTRLTSVTVANRFYECGSIVQYKYEYWNMRNPVYGISMGKNGDHRFIDWEVLPSKDLGLKVDIDRAFRVEQTSQVKITVDPPLRPARWENGIYYPAEKVYVMLRDTEGPYGQLIHEDYREITADNPFATFQFTPYRGTCNSNGVSSGLKKVWVPGVQGQPGYYKTMAYDLRVRIVAFKDDGGYNEMDQVPPSKKIIDPFWERFYNPIVEGTRYSQYPWSPPPYPIPPFLPSMQHGYDCFSDYRYEVAPEELKFIPSTKCVGLLDQRFPNLTLKLKDADNPYDVNDPQGITVSVPDGEEVAVIYNANGGGIEYMFTGFLKEPTRGILYGNKNKPVSDTNVSTSLVDRIIGQVNTDGTLVYWHWKDIGPHPGMLDDGDIIWAPNAADAGIDPSLWPSTVPGYIKIIDRQITRNLVNNDCSIETPSCRICGSGNFNKFGHVSYGDTYGPFFIATYGVPSYIRNYGEETRTATDEGGDILVTVIPQDAMSKLNLQVYSYNILFDYNSTIKHPPYFIVDEAVGNFAHDVDFDFNAYNGSGLQRYSYMGIDYCGVHEFKVLPSDPYLNFAEMSIVDHGLQNSRVNYTAPAEDAQGQKRGLSPLAIPTPQIQSPYNPMVLDVGKDFRAYPGGQSHTGRVKGAIISGGVARTDTDHSGWNAYPAIWWWFWHAGTNQTNFTDFNKLGTEFFPMTDYGIYFILKDIDGNHLSFSEDVAIDQRLRRIEVVGSYARPKVFNEARNTIRSDYEYNGTKHVPIVYDWSGNIIIDRSNYQDFEYALGDDWTRVDGQNDQYDYVNPFLRETKRLDYRRMRNVFRLEEIIPIGQSVLQLRVTLWDGTVKIYQDCCAEPPTDGVDTHALNVAADLDAITADVDNKIVATITEASSMQEERYANDALVYAWQDRGVLNPRTRLFDGAGDGWVTNPPRSSLYSGVSPQYERSDDLNGDGKISFADYETEIIGTYDMATNTWAGGVIDARTFQRNNGQYVFDLSSSNGALINTVGIDFGGNFGKPDHIISDFERLPVMITAYKYGDDNNDRAFTPLYNFGGNQGQYSHEVYLAGQKFIEVAPKMDLSVSVQPNPLTAGVTPELVDPVSPLTFVVTDDEGNPVDLSRGVPDASGNNLVENEDIWNHLFKDPHPDPLPEYYWLRTDLHNDDGTRINNRRLYSTASKPFQPIAIDFTLAKDGKYAFRGFCANDEGSFDVYIYTPDRKHAAKATVNVVLPTLEYSIVNTEDQAGTAFDTPGNPDFLLTAADNRLYRITVSVKNAQGLLLKGITRGVSTCGGGIKNTARFTPYSTRPASFDFTERDRYLFAEHFLQDLYPYMLHVGFDFNDNGKIDVRNSELYTLGAFRHTANRSGQVSQGQVFYNTTLYRYDEQSLNAGWDITPNPQLPPPLSGWGLGAIYNSAHRGGYLFSDIDGDGRLTFNDALGLDVNGQTTFYIFAEDLAYIGGLSGQNVYCNNPAEADLVGYPPSFKTDPFSVIKRFDPNRTPDGTFFLDWEALPNKEVQIAAPNLRALEAKTRVELSKDLLNANNYDLVYATENHMVVEVRPADSRDLPMKEDGRVFLIGNQHQTAIYGHTKASAADPKVMETTLHFTPTGLNENIAYLGYFNLNRHYLKDPYNLRNTSTYTLRNLVHLDSIVGLKVEIVTSGPLNPNKMATITAKVTEIGTNAPVQGATVNVEGPGIKASKTTDKDGIATFDVTPNDKGVVKVVASKEGRIIGMAEIRVLTDTTAPWIELDPVHPITNRPQQEVNGRTNPGNTVTLNGGPAQVAQDGSFKGTVTLKEGLNTIVGEAKNAQGMTVRKMVTVVLRTTPPNLFIDDPGYLVDLTEVEITGRVDVLYSSDHEYPAKVTVNGQPAHVTHDIWKAMVKVNPGRNTINVEAIDAVGNRNTASREILVYKRTIIHLVIDNPIPIINGEPAAPLDAPPFISGGRTMVPLRFIAEAFGASVNYDATTKGITIDLGDMNISMQIGNTMVMVNGKSYTIDAPPVIVSNRTFVPVRFVAEILGATVEYDATTRTVKIVRDTLP